MTTDTDHAADCDHSWCVTPHVVMCTCSYSNAQPHKREGCRYATDEPTDDPPEDDRP